MVNAIIDIVMWLLVGGGIAAIGHICYRSGHRRGCQDTRDEQIAEY